ASQTEIETVEVVARLEPVRGGDRQRRQTDDGTHLVARDVQSVARAQETVAEKAADGANDTACADLSAIQQTSPEKMRGLVRRDLTADETGRRDHNRVLPVGRHIEKWPGQNRIALRTGPKIGRCVPPLKKAHLYSGCSSVIEPEACLRSPTGSPLVVDGGVP